MPKPLSRVVKNLLGQPMFQMLSKINDIEKEGRKIIHYEIGDPDFDTPKNIKDKAINEITNGNTHYVDSKGLREFRELIRSTTALSRGFKPNIEQILVTPGANYIIYLAISTLVEPGEEILVPNPGFPTYLSASKYLDAKINYYNLKFENGFKIDFESLEKLITRNTKLLIVNSPSNPMGSVISKDDAEKIAELVEKHDLYLLSDEVYSRLIFENDNFFTPTLKDKCKDRSIIINGFSKSFSMTGWRLGVAIGPEEIISKMALIVETISSCTPPFIQSAGIEAIAGDQKEIDAIKKEIKLRIDVMANGLNQIKGIQCIKPEGAMYLFPRITGTDLSSEGFADLVLDKCSIGLLPGNNFGSEGEGHVRLCCTNNIDIINVTLERLSRLFGKK